MTTVARSPAIQKGFRAGVSPWNKGQKLPPEILTKDEIARLLKVPSPRAKTGVRNKALLGVMYRAGLRVSEALALETRDVDMDACRLHVRHGKGDRARYVGIDAGGLALVQRWLDIRSTLHPRSRRVFITLAGEPLDGSYVRALLPRLALKAGIEKRVHPHALRHTCAYEMMMEGVPVPVIQQQLGHTNLSTTSGYLAHIAPAQLLQTMRNREWEA